MKFVVFASGNGSNLQSIIDQVKKHHITAQLVLVISDNPKAFALQRAEKAGIPVAVFNPKDYTNKQSVDRDMVIRLKKEKIDFIVLAGYMRLLTPFFVKQYNRKIINVHPTLLPSFKGLNGIKDAMTYGAKVTGVTIHFVDEMMDHGPIIMQESVKIQPKDTIETLAEKIHRIEHRIFPKVIQMYVEGRLKIKQRRVIILDKVISDTPVGSEEK